MKYIRTKDNAIYKIENNKLIVGNIKVNCNDLQALEQDGYKIADSIEELCDEFVYNHQILSKEDKNNKEYLSQLYCFNDIYGAIWTDKGLIYVAKMNSKGTLELI